MNKKRNTRIDIFILIIAAIITYVPVSAFLFSLKNDSLVQYLPFRYHLSESIQHGYFPFWSPYLYTGFPIHADMQGMTWNPIVLVISLFTRYNMSILQFEVMIYLVLAAIGMYKLLKSFSVDRYICIVAGISYMSCGFINGSASVIPWISSAAFIPFVFNYLYRFFRQPSLRHSLFFSAALCMLFLCGYPTFFIYTCYIILAFLVYIFITNYNRREQVLTGRNIFYFLLAILLFFAVCSPAIISYWEFLPYYSRGSGITVSKAAENPLTWFSSISYIFPNLVSKDHAGLNTDPSMRNSYVGCFVFILFLMALLRKQTRLQWMLIGLTLFSFFLSLGEATPVHKFSYSVLPLFNTFRHPGNIRLFTSIGVIMVAAFYVQGLLAKNWESIRAKFLRLSIWFAVAMGLIALFVIFQPAVKKNLSVVSKIRQPKLFMEWIEFESFIFIEAVLQLLFCIVLIFHLRKRSFHSNVIATLFAMNSILFCWISLPSTFISQIRTKSVNQYVRSFPDGYPLPEASAPVEAAVISDSTDIPIYGYPNFYNKKITIQDHVITPTLNKDYEVFNNNRAIRKRLNDYPLSYISDSVTTDSINTPANEVVRITAFRPGRFIFSLNPVQPGELVLFQQYNHNWKAFVNGKAAEIQKANTAFMKTRIPEGNSTVEFIYKPRKVILAMWVSFIVILSVLAYFVISYLRARNHEPEKK
jgi:hypothetical protein